MNTKAIIITDYPGIQAIFIHTDAVIILCLAVIMALINTTAARVHGEGLVVEAHLEDKIAKSSNFTDEWLLLC